MGFVGKFSNTFQLVSKYLEIINSLWNNGVIYVFYYDFFRKALLSQKCIHWTVPLFMTKFHTNWKVLSRVFQRYQYPYLCMEYGTQIWTLQAYNSEFLPKSLLLGGKEKSKKINRLGHLDEDKYCGQIWSLCDSLLTSNSHFSFNRHMDGHEVN